MCFVGAVVVVDVVVGDGVICVFNCVVSSIVKGGWHLPLTVLMGPYQIRIVMIDPDRF